MCLKLVKSGQVVTSSELKSHFFNAAKEMQLLSDQQLLDPKKLEHLKDQLDKMVTSKNDIIVVENGDFLSYFRRLEKRFGKLKKNYDQKLLTMFKEFTTFRADEYSSSA